MDLEQFRASDGKQKARAMRGPLGQKLLSDQSFIAARFFSQISKIFLASKSFS